MISFVLDIIADNRALLWDFPGGFPLEEASEIIALIC
jgi:hypothetical protein